MKVEGQYFFCECFIGEYNFCIYEMCISEEARMHWTGSQTSYVTVMNINNTYKYHLVTEMQFQMAI